MTQIDKVEMLKDTISFLYEKEGRSKVYISELLKVNRNILTQKIKEWELVKADVRHLTPSNQKFLNKNKKAIIDLLDSDVGVSEIAKRFEKSKDSMVKTFICTDKELLHHYNMQIKRKQNATQERVQAAKDKSARNYDFEEIENEVWKEILGYKGYYVSNMGRVKKRAERYKTFYLLAISKNQVSGRCYVSIVNNDGKTKNLILSRLVAHNFVDGWSEQTNTVDHIDGDITNNRADNLEWVSQGENNKRAYDNGKKTHKSYSKNGKFHQILVDDKYEFKTIKALAKFLNVSETQAQRYMDGTSRTSHTFQLLY